ncbi:ribosomal protection-like ABC-F family protein [Hydrocarboniclastica marina]|uniref:Probable ATP-binding protein YheS n=1 Tax=Hydrocarboniclastica marina TaxID=2259620 RepID=A0A4P7XJP5_9ALTE|nr:ATP-binding cassette domain-containing protein [Hydrocarboniclastica marina]QCF27379.1 ATP-binding cassette domain-containing protein [Hydrocarboniclastica marina]
MLTITDLSLQRGGQPLLEAASVTIHPGQRAALVGANGSGKSSLFQLVLGNLAPDAGSITLPGGCRIAHMAQEVGVSERTARDYVLDGHEPLRLLEQQLAAAEAAGDDMGQARLHGELDLMEAWSAPRRAEELLRGLGFNDEQMDQPVSRFSGGWRIRLNLAQALMRPSDLLLLDEPTNHLDIDACFWLEQWLRRYPGTLVFISHDRDFMDRVATHIIHLQGRRLDLYTGNFSGFEQQRAQRLSQQQAQFERQQQRIGEIQRFIDRFRAQATKARQAQSRIKALERMEKIAAVQSESGLEFRFPAADKTSNPLLSIRDGVLGHGGVPLLSEVKLTLLPGTRVGLLGANGAGKSTLMEVLRGARSLISGDRITGEHFRPGYFAQHQLEALDLNASPFQHLHRRSPEVSDQVIRNFLGGFGFSNDDALATIRNASGGEKARLALALVAWEKPNVLLLDEPTNHLDLAMRDALTFALQQFEGALVVVSHDRHLLRHTVDEFWQVEQGRVREFDGDLDDYERWLVERRAATASPDLSSAAAGRLATETGNERAESADERKLRKRAEAEVRRQLSPYRKKMQSLEATIERLQKFLSELEQSLTDTRLYEEAGKSDLKALLARQAEAKAQLDDAEAEWLEVGEAVEELEAQLVD